MPIIRFIAAVAMVVITSPALAEPIKLYCAGNNRLSEIGGSNPKDMQDTFYLEIDHDKRTALASGDNHPKDRFTIEVTEIQYKNLSNNDNPEHGKGLRMFDLDRQTLEYTYRHPISFSETQYFITAQGHCSLYDAKI